ncbi:MAG: dihydrofolate reductase family protein [Bacteroidota bacterium]
MKKRQLILYIAVSLDGYIAKPGDDLSFLDRVQKEGEDYGYMRFMQSVDTVIIGRRTYDWVVEKIGGYPGSGKTVYVISRTNRISSEGVHFYSGGLKDLITELKNQPGKDLFCDGGAEIVNLLLDEKLFDELIISVVPVLTGDGIRLFRDGRPEQDLELVSAKSFDTGLVQLHYRVMGKDR